VTAQYEATTTVRRPRVALMWAAVAVYVAAFVGLLIGQTVFRHWGSFGGAMWWTIGPLIAAIQRKPKVEQLTVSASPEGLRMGSKLLPRAKLHSALMRSEGDRSYVTLRGRSWGSNVDIAVGSDSEADELCAALGLDAKSTTAEFSLFRGVPGLTSIAAGLGLVAAAVGFTAAILAHASVQALIAFPFAMVLFIALLVPLLLVLRRVSLRVGADGILVREGINRRRFHAHDSIASVRAVGKEVVIRLNNGQTLRWEVAPGQRSGVNQARIDEHTRQAQSVVWRIRKAQEAYRALAGGAPQTALALDRGERSLVEWIDALRRVGEGEGATFRHALPTRDQLLAIVESTTALAKERLAAAVALRAKLTEEEKPRVRVAAERCVAPALRERMVRVIDAPSDEELATVLEEAEQDAAAR
jgi:hypothetical protein